MNPNALILQEASQTLTWFDNFAFLTEGVFMVSLKYMFREDLRWKFLHQCFRFEDMHFPIQVGQRLFGAY